MKKHLSIFLLLIFSASYNFAVYAEKTDTESVKSVESAEEFDMGQAMEQDNSIGAYFGYTTIGDQSYVSLNFQPQLQLGKLGIGLDVPIQVNTSTWNIRTDQYKDGVAWLRMIRSLSWGIKEQDPLYVKVGNLSGAYLGYGMLLDNYSNSISVDKRKIGAEIDYCYNNFIGIEVLYSDLNVKSLNLLGVRPYIKPLAFTGIPIVKTLDIGLQYVTDRDNTGSMLSTDESSDHNTYVGSAGMTGVGLDMGVTLINTSMARLVAFGSAAMLKKNTNALLKDSLSRTTSTDLAASAQNYKNGYGIGAGLDFKFKFLGNLFRLDTRLERLWYTDYFIPHFFDVTYEINKDERILSLVSAKSKKGIYGDIGLTVLDKVKVGGGLMLPDEVGTDNPAMVKINLDASELTDQIILKGEYIKGGLTTLEDAFKLDERSLLYVRLAYKVAKFVYAGVDYNWTWAANADGKFVPNSSWSPYVGMKFDLGF
jgi:hypothetical protein